LERHTDSTAAVVLLNDLIKLPEEERQPGSNRRHSSASALGSQSIQVYGTIVCELRL
jgi:hypothetical protein